MGEEEILEEEYYGSRCFRKLADGRIVEVIDEGDYRENFFIDGKAMNGYGITMDMIGESMDRQYEHEEYKPADDPGGKAGSSGEEGEKKQRKPTMQEVIDKAIKKWTPDDDFGSGGQMNSGGDMSSGKGLGGGGQIGVPDDPLKKAAEKKVETYSAHMAKVRDAYKKKEAGKASGQRGLGDSIKRTSMQGIKKKIRFK